ncbi:MAG TPA: hypothetical protein VJ813_10005 [Vicinamibacterales bacterium]|nr:hypothetical protein [Vicinamibacterales bacterium]
MIVSRVRPGFAAVLLTAAIAAAGSSPVGAAPQRPEPAATRQGANVQAPVQGALNQNAAETRRDFYKVLDQYPPALGRVMRLDPTLMTNPSYLASYPNIAAFFAQYPDVPRNPGYYLERYDPNYAVNEPTDARQESLRMWRDALEFMGAFAVFAVVMFAFFSLIKYVVEYRRWHRISKVNAEVHNKILDRFASNEELLAYVDSPAGRRFLEATPIAPSAAPVRSIGAPFGRILLSVQVGVILLALAAGFLVISGRAIEEVQPVLVSLAVLGFCLGTGSIVSAGASYVLSRKLGLLPETPSPRPEHIG